jgi:hypothetical protein
MPYAPKGATGVKNLPENDPVGPKHVAILLTLKRFG